MSPYDLRLAGAGRLSDRAVAERLGISRTAARWRRVAAGISRADMAVLTQRLDRVRELLSDAPRSSKRLAAEMGVSDRTARRYLAELADAGEAEPSGEWDGKAVVWRLV